MSFILLGILNSQAAGAVGGASYDLLESTVLTSSASSVSFTGLDSYTDYKHLQIRWTGRGDRAGSPADQLYMRINGDTGFNYDAHNLWGNGTQVRSQNFTPDPQITIYYVSAATATTSAFGAGFIDVLDFSSTSKNTTIRNLSGLADVNTTVALVSGLHRNTSAVTSMSFYPSVGNLIAGSRFSLYGIK